MTWSRLAGLACAPLAALGCPSSHIEHQVESAPPPAVVDSSPTTDALEPTAAPAKEIPEAPSVPPLPSLELLPVEGHGPAVISLPGGEREYPLVVVAHGAGGRPEWHCELWRQLVRRRGVVLCVRGRRVDQREPYERAGCYFPDHHYLTEVVTASRSALVAAYPHINASRAVYSGYSQGAVMGALMIARWPQGFARALLIEGGGAQWNVPIALKYNRGGGEKIAFLCGQASCAAAAEQGRSWLENGGIEVRAVHVEGGGHTSFGEVGERIPELFEWLVSDDPRWRAEGD